MEIFLHKQDIHNNKCRYNQQESRISRTKKETDTGYSLHRHIDYRNYNMRNVQFVGHNLISMFSVREGYVLVQQQTMDNCKTAVYAVHGKKSEPREIMCVQNQTSDIEK